MRTRRVSERRRSASSSQRSVTATVPRARRDSVSARGDPAVGHARHWAAAPRCAGPPGWWRCRPGLPARRGQAHRHHAGARPGGAAAQAALDRELAAARDAGGEAGQPPAGAQAHADPPARRGRVHAGAQAQPPAGDPRRVQRHQRGPRAGARAVGACGPRPGRRTRPARRRRPPCPGSPSAGPRTRSACRRRCGSPGASGSRTSTGCRRRRGRRGGRRGRCASGWTAAGGRPPGPPSRSGRTRRGCTTWSDRCRAAWPGTAASGCRRTRSGCRRGWRSSRSPRRPC